MESNGQRGASTNFLLLLVAGGLGYGIGRYTLSLTGQISGYLIGFGVVIALVSWFHMRLEEQERLEQLEFEEVNRGAASSSLFNTGESETFPARHSRESFERFFVPIFSGVLAIGQGVVAVWVWRSLSESSFPQIKQPLLGLGLFGGMFIVLFLIGQYSTGVARIENRRLLRPGGNLLLLAAYLCAISAAVLGAVVAEFPRADVLAARAICILLGLLALEGMISVVFDLYRPRVKGKAVHPLYDSRLIGLLSHPEGVFSTAASALDYQFGFKVSDTWFYQFLQKSFGWLLLGQVGLLLFSTCFVFVNPGEQALLERLGRPVTGREILDPGLHLTLPWPIDEIRRYRTEEIQSFIVGGIPDESKTAEVAFLWSVSHFKEEFNLLSPSPGLAIESGEGTGNATRSKAPLSFLTVSIPIHYQISDLKAYAYNYENSAQVVEQVAYQEVGRYFAQNDSNELLTRGQGIAAEQLRLRIQERIDGELHLGVKILFLGLQDIHPPVRVASAYEEVVSARQWAETNRLDALAFSASTNVLASVEARRIIAQEESRSAILGVKSLADAARFTNQIIAYAASPAVYRHRMFLQAYTNGLAGSRKIVITTTNSGLVIQYDAQERFSSSLARQLAPVKKN